MMPPIFMGERGYDTHGLGRLVRAAQQFAFRADELPRVRVIGSRLFQQCDSAWLIMLEFAGVSNVKRSDPRPRIFLTRFMGRDGGSGEKRLRFLFLPQMKECM